MRNTGRLREFIQLFTRLVDQHDGDEERILAHGETLLANLISHDDWLPKKFARESQDRYQQYLLYCDPMERFSVVSFVWGPGQATPVHDHTVWGIVGVMRGEEACEEFEREFATSRLKSKGMHNLAVGGTDLVSPRIGDIHKVSNAFIDRSSISIHIYGADIGAVKRHVYDLDTGCRKTFVSGYANNAPML